MGWVLPDLCVLLDLWALPDRWVLLERFCNVGATPVDGE
jgi:hypothetical protein